MCLGFRSLTGWTSRPRREKSDASRLLLLRYAYYRVFFEGYLTDSSISVQSSPAQVKDQLLSTDSGEFGQWLRQEGHFALPDLSSENPPTGMLRLVTCVWSDDSKWELPFSQERWLEMIQTLQLPKSYAGDLSSVTTPLSLTTDNAGIGASPLGLALNWFLTSEQRITTALSYAPDFRLTQGFYAAHNAPYHPTRIILERVLQAKDHIKEPLLLPLIIYDWALQLLRSQLHPIERELQRVKRNLGVINPAALVAGDWGIENQLPEEKSFTRLHQTIVTQHVYLMNFGFKAVHDFRNSINSAINQIEKHCRRTRKKSNGPNAAIYDGFHSRQFLQLTSFRNRYLFLWHEILVQDVHILLQVLYNLMQQEVARETRRDSSAMKSIALLTMIFLPATAIATIMAPFTKISDDDKLQVTAQFWVFWATAGPVTFVVLALWALWTQRTEVSTVMKDNLERLKGVEMLMKRKKNIQEDVELSSIPSVADLSRRSTATTEIRRRSTTAARP
ncbi:hypothetical protein B0T21DRAFT_356563 [Apiosordaria backusii]|uniref:Uncharacterized protein n=1 Tax=Apiosordaria backusii TaxID=314023 RepID=A0AA40EZZ3_9PEZI|nr:hypothetical protein B0T21DRAFT_356563 [Apiosordaria backusii]